jgi:hypothetical protein
MVAALLSFVGRSLSQEDTCLGSVTMAEYAMENPITYAVNYNQGAKLAELGQLSCNAGFVGAGSASCGPATPTATTSTIDLETELGIPTGESGGNKYQGGVAGPDTKLYFLPFAAEHVLIVDTTDNSLDSTTMSGLGNDARKWSGGVLGVDHKIYGIPYNAAEVLVIDTVAGTATRDAVGMGGLGGSTKWFGGVLGPDRKIYGIPYEAAQVLIIDYEQHSTDVTTMDWLGSGSTTHSMWAGGVLSPDNGKIYCIPFTTEEALIVDTATQLTDRMSIRGVSPGVGTKYMGGVLGSNRKVGPRCAVLFSGGPPQLTIIHVTDLRHPVRRRSCARH